MVEKRYKISIRAARRARCGIGALAIALLSACGGYDNPPACDTVSQQVSLRDYFFDWYFWYALSPYPGPGSVPTVDAYFDGLLYTGTDPNFPADRWSFHQSTASFNRFFNLGQTLSYGIFVAGLEVAGAPTQPLYVRYVEPLSPAARAGITRGDRIVSINGRTAADMIVADDFSVLTPNAVGDTVSVVLDNTGGQRTVSVSAEVFSLTPVSGAAVVQTPLGRKVGYLPMKDMIDQASAPLNAAFASFAAAGVTELVIDLRYNGGGLVSVGRELASYVNPTLTAGRTYASLLYNNKRAAQFNTSFLFRSPGPALTLTRAYVLQGARTCSAAEQVVNGLRPFVDVVLVGDTTCGKPVGFLPADDGCGRTYNVVNFEAVNASIEGRYFDGLAPNCAVAENFTSPLGSPNEPLLGTALNHADGQGCLAPAAASAHQQAQSARLRAALRRNAEGEHPAMIPR